MTFSIGQSSWSVTRIRFPKISSSRAAWALGSIRQASRSAGGSCPVSSVVITRATQRGAQIWSISASTLGPGPAGLAAGQLVGQAGQGAGGLGQGLGEPDLLGGVQGRGMRQDHPAFGAQYHGGGLQLSLIHISEPTRPY